MSGSLTFDAAGNLYGTTNEGGTYYGHGIVFELTPTGGGNWTETVVHDFANGSDGNSPYAGVIFDTHGNLYGVNIYGGTYNWGTAFEFSPNGGGGWTETELYSFDRNGTDGFNPLGTLIFDAAGNLYGTTFGGGLNGRGTVFELSPNGSGGWTETILYNFCSQSRCADGRNPFAGLIFDRSGNLYGTTTYGGSSFGGTVFELSPDGSGGWTETVLHNFNQNGTDGAYPEAALVFDAAGNLYGTTSGGGTYYYGTAFEMSPAGGGNWTETVLHSFNNDGTDGASPYAPLILDRSGNLYGTTEYGGTDNSGTVFEITP